MNKAQAYKLLRNAGYSVMYAKDVADKFVSMYPETFIKLYPVSFKTLYPDADI